MVQLKLEKKKGDVISRITADVLEIQHSFLSWHFLT
jgi:ABC-type transport system involved in cytochrome bd biosynthesis fused ATPase/permease subunit